MEKIERFSIEATLTGKSWKNNLYFNFPDYKLKIFLPRNTEVYTLLFQNVEYLPEAQEQTRPLPIEINLTKDQLTGLFIILQKTLL